MNNIPSAFKNISATGVLYVTEQAGKKGFTDINCDWCNLGQGQPETIGFLNEPARINKINISTSDYEYAPMAGIGSLREIIADFYNRNYRVGKKNKYSADNVVICPGGRAAMTRVVASLNNVNLGHFLPDYTAYEELLGIFRDFNSIPILLSEEDNYYLSLADLQKEIVGRGLGAILLSNPCNPTGKTIAGEALNDWIGLIRKLQSSIIFDEFYSHYIWDKNHNDTMVSAAKYIDDIEKDQVVIVDGLTKNWRYPGFRLSWILGPKKAVNSFISAGSFLDGGANRAIQENILDIFSDDYIQQKNKMLQKVFIEKRNFLLGELRKVGIEINFDPQGGFYIWGSTAKLAKPLQVDMDFFKAGLKEKVITVPGSFFDINPGKRRHFSRFANNIRFSFGPSLPVLKKACERLQKMVSQY